MRVTWWRSTCFRFSAADSVLLQHEVSADRHHPGMLGGLESFDLDMDIQNAENRRRIAFERLAAEDECTRAECEPFLTLV